MEELDSTTKDSPTSSSRNEKPSETEQAGSELVETESEFPDLESENAETESDIADVDKLNADLDALTATVEAVNAEIKRTEADTDEEDALLESDDETDSESTETESVETQSAPATFKSKAGGPKILELEEGKEVEIVAKVEEIVEKKEEKDEKEIQKEEEKVEKETQKEEEKVEKETQKELKKTEAQAPPLEPELRENPQTQVLEKQASSAETDTNSDRPEVEIIKNDNHRRYSVESNGENNIRVVGETEEKKVSGEPEIIKDMAGPQHPFPTGFPNTQPNAIRNQFGGGQMVSGLMGPQQGMVSPQQFNSGVAGGVSPNALGMLNAQQVMNQQQVIPPSLQHQQQMHMQQQQQQAALAQNNQAGAPTTSQIPVPQNQPPPQRQGNRDINTASLCKLGQETVQEIVSRMMEFFQLMKVMQPPNGTPQGQSHATEKKTKIQDQLKTISLLFKRLRVIYEKCNENCQLQGMEYTHIESLIPIKEEWDMKSDEKKASEAYRLASEENKEVMEQLVQRNRQLKEIIEHLRRIISEINTMMAMRRS